MVNEVWHGYEEDFTGSVLYSGEDDDDDDDGNPWCEQGGWFHLECVGLLSAPRGNWWCSLPCQEYSDCCFCKRNLTCETIECKNCAKSFHLKCVGLVYRGKNNHYYNKLNKTSAHVFYHWDGKGSNLTDHYYQLHNYHYYIVELPTKWPCIS